MLVRAPPEGRALDAVEADAAGADGRDVAAGAHGGGVEDGADARDHAAGQERRALERHLRRNQRHLRGVDHDLLGEGPGPEALADRRAVARAQRRAQIERQPGLAQLALAARAEGAVAAGAQQGDDDVVARPDPRDPGAHLLDDPGRLMAGHRRQLAAPGAREEEQVAVADRAGLDPDPDLARPRFRELDLLDRERASERATDRRFHP